MALTYEQLDHEYRAALRREVRLIKQIQDRDEALLRLKGKLLIGVQEIDFDVRRFARESQHRRVGDELAEVSLHPPQQSPRSRPLR